MDGRYAAGTFESLKGFFSPFKRISVVTGLAATFIFPSPAYSALPSPDKGSVQEPGPLAVFEPQKSDLALVEEEVFGAVMRSSPSSPDALISGLYILEPGRDDDSARKLLSRVGRAAKVRGSGLSELLDLSELYLAASAHNSSFKAELEKTLSLVVERFSVDGGGLTPGDGAVDVAQSARFACIVLKMNGPPGALKEFDFNTLDTLAGRCIRPSIGAASRCFPAEGRATGFGYLVDNAWAGLSFIEGYRRTEDERYLEAATDVADFISKNLFDAKTGGFIKRNYTGPAGDGVGRPYMADKDFYENSVALLFMSEISALDRRFLTVVDPAIGYLSGELHNARGDLNTKGAGYFVRGYSIRLSAIGQAQRHAYARNTDTGSKALSPALLLLAFLAGVLSFLSPCTLPILPAYFAFASQGERAKIVLMTTAFFLGLATVFSLMGATAGFAGSFIRTHTVALNIVAGTVITAFGLMSMAGRGFGGLRTGLRPAGTIAGSFVFGATMAVGWTACVGPVLASFLIMAAREETVAGAMVLLFVYAMGLGLPLIIVSALLKGMDRGGRLWKILKGSGLKLRLGRRTFYVHTANVAAGLVLVATGVLVMTGRLSSLNSIVPEGLAGWLSRVEEALMGVFM